MSTKKLQIVGSMISQSDWNQTDETQADYIKNKPQIDNELTEGSENLITSGAVADVLGQKSQIQIITWEADD